MLSARVPRVLASLLAFLAGIAVPGTSVTHGFAHAHAREAFSDHHDDTTALHAHRPAHAVARAADHSGEDHTHPQLDRGTAVRFAAYTPTVSIPELSPVFTVTEVVRETLVVAAARPRADPGHSPPTLPRSSR